MGKEAIEVIQALGFPIVVSLWFMLRMERKLEKMLDTQKQIIDIVTKGKL